ncbi:MAG: NAD-dependent epimerase/dehydratase family protein [Propionicimonas sp.]
MKHLIAGAGPIGSAVAQQLVEAGHTATILSRSGRGPRRPGVALVAGDAADADLLADLAQGAAAIFNCLNPAYTRWPTDWPPLARALETAAARSGAVLVTTSNLYGYGPHDGPITPDLPLAAIGPKGTVRARMWLDALALHEAGRLRATEVRGSDYIGPDAEGHLGDRVVPRLLAGRSITVLGSADVPHTWTYTVDMARTLVAAAHDERAWGKAWHAVSNPPRTQHQAIDDLADAAGVERVAVTAYPAVVVRAMRLVIPLIRELQETEYQFTAPFVLDDSATRTTFGLEPTPWTDVLAAQLDAFTPR